MAKERRWRSTEEVECAICGEPCSYRHVAWVPAMYARPPHLRLWLETNRFDVWHPYRATELSDAHVLKVENIPGEMDYGGFEEPTEYGGSPT